MLKLDQYELLYVYKYCVNTVNIYLFTKYYLVCLYMKQAYNFRVTLQRFDGHLSRVYTRAVFKKYRDTYVYSTAFRIDPDADNIDSFLVTHTNQSWQYAWFQHSFKVQANVREGK